MARELRLFTSEELHEKLWGMSNSKAKKKTIAPRDLEIILMDHDIMYRELLHLNIQIKTPRHRVKL